MSEITRMLARELERPGQEDRLREERLTSLVTQQLKEQRRRDEDLMGQLQRFAERLNGLERLWPS